MVVHSPCLHLQLPCCLLRNGEPAMAAWVNPSNALALPVVKKTSLPTAIQSMLRSHACSVQRTPSADSVIAQYFLPNASHQPGARHAHVWAALKLACVANFSFLPSDCCAAAGAAAWSWHSHVYTCLLRLRCSQLATNVLMKRYGLRQPSQTSPLVQHGGCWHVACLCQYGHVAGQTAMRRAGLPVAKSKTRI